MPFEGSAQCLSSCRIQIRTCVFFTVCVTVTASSVLIIRVFFSVFFLYILTVAVAIKLVNC